MIECNVYLFHSGQVHNDQELHKIAKFNEQKGNHFSLKNYVYFLPLETNCYNAWDILPHSL